MDLERKTTGFQGTSHRLVIIVALVLCAGSTFSVTSAAAATYAPIDTPGPALTVPARALDAALDCSPSLASASRDVVLMMPGTTLTPAQSYAWNYEVAFGALHIPYCTITVPNFTDNDIQVAAQYVVNAVRTINTDTGRQVVMFGWSQGGSTLPRWALRFWPDIRQKVASLVALAPVNNIGLPVASGLCDTGSCVPAAWQQSVGSHFMAALNSDQQTFPDIAYTVIYTRFDDVVSPDITGALSVLPSGPNVTNVAIQSLCLTETTDHLLILASPTGFAVAINAIDHPGHPADLAEVHAPPLCAAGTMPYVTPQALITGEAAMATQIPYSLATGEVTAEPPLACYATASCPRTAPTRRPKHHRRRRKMKRLSRVETSSR